MINKLNNLSTTNQAIELEKCCGSQKWVNAMTAACPFLDIDTLHKTCDDIWETCEEADYLEAFMHHPQIGDIDSLKRKFANTSKWASNEQKGANEASDEILEQLKLNNGVYLKRFGFIFIVCATGKTAKQMLDLLNARLPNQRSDEILIAASEQNKITHLRLDKLLEPQSIAEITGPDKNNNDENNI